MKFNLDSEFSEIGEKFLLSISDLLDLTWLGFYKMRGMMLYQH